MSRKLAGFLLIVVLLGVSTLWRTLKPGTNLQTSKPSRPDSSKQSHSPALLGIKSPQTGSLHQSAASLAAASFSPPLRVNLTPAPVKRLQIAVDSAFRVRQIGSESVIYRGAQLGSTTVTLTRAGFRIGRRDVRLSSPKVAGLEIEAINSPAIWVNDHQYRGTIRLYRRGDETFIAVNRLPLEEYIASVVDSEMPRKFPAAARRAQAIVARTYAVSQMQGHPLFDLFATSQSQRYLGFQYRDQSGRRLAGESSDSRQITRQTAGMVCTFRGKTFRTYYSAVCGGRTTPGRSVFTDAAPPLKSVACNWCSSASRYRWTKQVSTTLASQSFRKYFERRGQQFATLSSVASAGSEPGGYPTYFVIGDGKWKHRLSSVEIRRRVFPKLLPSARFTVEKSDHRLLFRGRGHGHGVGMCQWGARGLALRGDNFLKIIHHYYPGCKIVVQKP